MKPSTNVDIPIPMGSAAWETVMAVTSLVLEEWHAEVTDVHDMPDGSICIDLRIDCDSERGEPVTALPEPDFRHPPRG